MRYMIFKNDSFIIFSGNSLLEKMADLCKEDVKSAGFVEIDSSGYPWCFGRLKELDIGSDSGDSERLSSKFGRK